MADSDALDWRSCVRHACRTDIGMRRSNNQDSFIELPAANQELWKSRGHLFIVADGMGAHAAGELASKIAVDTIPHNYHKSADLPPADAILKAVIETNREIHQRGQENAEFHRMGTTCSSLLLLPEGAVVAHVGDSRVYRLRQSQLEQLTFDHSLAWEMKAASKANAELSIPKNVITRSLGPNAQVQVDVEGPFEIQPGDTFLLCSDGLTGRIQDEEIASVIGCLDPEPAADMLVDLANVRGGPDNITVIVAKIVSPSDVPSVADDQLPASPLQRISVATWIAIGLFALLAVACLFVQQTYAALGCLAGLLIAIGVAAMQWYRSDQGTVAAVSRRLGKAPYVTVQRPADRSYIKQLIHDLRNRSNLVEPTAWSETHEEFERRLEEAGGFAEKNDIRAAMDACHAAAKIMHRAHCGQRQNS